jgi:hypothetical protein
MEVAGAAKAARPREEMNATMSLVDRRTSTKEETKILAKASAKEDYWQGMLAPETLPSTSKDKG